MTSEKRTRPAGISTIANARLACFVGATSPYPTVVSVAARKYLRQGGWHGGGGGD